MSSGPFPFEMIVTTSQIENALLRHDYYSGGAGTLRLFALPLNALQRYHLLVILLVI